MRDLEIRVAALHDAAELAAIHVEGRRWAYSGLLPDRLLDSDQIRRERESRWARIVAEPGEVLTFVAEVGGRGVGLISAGPSRDDDATEAVAEVHSIYVRRRELAGQGIGRALMRIALGALRQRGFEEVVLWTLAANERAQAFYLRGGWRPDGVTKIASLAGTPLPHVRFARPIR